TPSGAGAFVLDPDLAPSALMPAAEPSAYGSAADGRRHGSVSGSGSLAFRSPSTNPFPSTDQLRAWLLPNVHRRLQAGRGEVLTELRPVAALFMSFDGIDFDNDPAAGDKLDSLLRWVQDEAERVGGTVVQLTTGDKGSYLYMACGAPVSHEDDVFRCATAALHLKEAPKVMSFIKCVSIGVSYGTARTGAYGSGTRRTYGALGEETNMAARLMGVAVPGTVYASQAFVRLAQEEYEFATLPPVKVKGRTDPVVVFELIGRKGTPTSVTRSAAGGPRLIGRQEELEAILSA